MALTEKQKRFADEYLIDLNATRAYRAAYPRTKTDAAASANGSRLLSKAGVAEYVKERMEERGRRTGITQDMVLRELAEIALRKTEDCADSKLKVSDKLKALELLGKHLGMFASKVEHSGTMRVELADELKEWAQ